MWFGRKRYPKIVRPNLSGKFSLKSPHENRKDNLNAPYLEVIVTDSVYIDISSVDDKILFALYTNAVKQGYEDIETDEEFH